MSDGLVFLRGAIWVSTWIASPSVTAAPDTTPVHHASLRTVAEASVRGLARASLRGVASARLRNAVDAQTRRNP